MKTALILPGGWTKGAIEFGACKVILKKITPDIIIGTSVGAINGAKLADSSDIEKNIVELESCWLKFNKKTFFPINYELFYKFYSANSLYSNKGIFNVLKNNINSKTFEELKIPLYINCTNMIDGKSEFFSSGDLINPIVASCSAAPILPPLEIGGIPFVDGAFGSYLGIKKAIDLKCERIIIINVDNFENFLLKDKSIKGYGEHMLAIARAQNMRNEIEICKNHNIEVIEILPVSPNFESISLNIRNVKEMIKLGEDAANKILDRI